MPQKEFLEALRACQIVVSAEAVEWTPEIERRLRETLDDDRLAKAKKRSEDVCAFRIRYRSSGHEVNGFVLLPNAALDEPLPCIIFNRGGSMEFGAIKLGNLFTNIGRMAEWGYVVIASQYSGNAGSEGKDEHGGADLNDVLVLRDILRSLPFADATRIGMYGGSRGGLMTYRALASVDWIRAAVSVAGVADAFRNAELRPEMRKKYSEMFDVNDEELRKRSAVHWTEAFCRETPLLLMHGTADWRVSPLDSLDLSRKLLACRVPHRLVLLEGGDHGLTEFVEERNRMARTWFERYLKEGEALPNLEPHGE